MTKGKDYYDPREITFTREQMIWLISELEVLESGRWPQNTYTDNPEGITPGQRNHAPFETPEQFAAEVRWRLQTTRKHGETLVWEIQHGLDYWEVLSPECRKVLNYISGWKRKYTPYLSWLRQRRYRRKLYKLNTLS